MQSFLRHRARLAIYVALCCSSAAWSSCHSFSWQSLTGHSSSHSKPSSDDAASNDKLGPRGGVEDLTIVVQADKSRILQEEADLKANRMNFDAERARLERERHDIADKLANLSKKDKSQRDKLEQAEQQLNEEQKQLRDKAQNFEAERNQLDQEKSRLLERISSLTDQQALGSNGHSPEQRAELLARREHNVALREKDVARREAESGRNLSDIGHLLEEVRDALQAHQSALLSGNNSPHFNAGGRSGRSAALRQQQQSRSLLQSKGILLSDLSIPSRELDVNAANALKEGDFASAQQLWAALTQAVDALVVNQAFVQAKMARISRQFDEQKLGNTLDATRKKKIQSLLGDATDAFSDGRFDRANRTINQIYALLAPN